MARSKATWLAFVLTLVCFGAPLYIGLAHVDLENDEAIYSYAVDRALATHAWLTPRGIYDDGPFLEKPPLKEWIVEAGIAAGLPHDEVGLRFFDQLFGILAFAYVFALGRRLAGPVCGAIAVGLLFTFRPLVFVHGLRTNNMEAALLLTYCAGIYHFARWAAAERGAGGHAWAFAGWFAFGFMTKFVAALFLPVVAAAAFLCQRNAISHVRARIGEWVWPAIAACAAIVPWFAYERVKYGAAFWAQIFGKQVYQRMTSYLDPNHVRPWWFYLAEIHSELSVGHREFLIAAGVVLLAGYAWRGRPWTARLVLAWLVIPVIAISLFTSKLTHYVYPFVPPLALAGGWAAALWLRFVWIQTEQVVSIHGLRPVLRATAVLALAVVLPLRVYADMFPRLAERHEPLQALRRCILNSTAPRKAWMPASGPAIEHEYYYYLNPDGEWARHESTFETEVFQRIVDPQYQSPVFVWRRDLPALEARAERPAVWRSLQGVNFPGDLVLLLPGPYAACATKAVEGGGALFTMPEGSPRAQ